MSAEIVQLPSRHLHLTQPVLSQVEGYWDGLRNGRAAPSRAEINPRGLEGALPHCFIVERIAPGLGRFRVCGQHVNTIFGRDLRGMPFGLLFVPDARDRLEELLESIFAVPAIVDCVLEVPGSGPKGAMRLLPVRDDLGRITRVLGCLCLETTLGPKPMRLTITNHSVRPVQKASSVSPSGPDTAGVAPIPGRTGQVVSLDLPAR